MRYGLSFAAFVACFTLLAAQNANAFEIGSRRLDVAGALDVKAGTKLATDLMKLDEVDHGPIYLLVTGSGGSAQGVMLAADTIKAIESPVVAVVMAPVQGAVATLPAMCDRVVMLPSAALVLTEVDYEGVAKPVEPKPDAKPEDKKEPTKTEAFLQKVRVEYLERFWASVAKRLGEKPATLAADIAAGGRVVTASEALAKKIAFEVAATITTSRLPSVKTEIKSTTTKNRTATVPDDAPGTN